MYVQKKLIQQLADKYPEAERALRELCPEVIAKNEVERDLIALSGGPLDKKAAFKYFSYTEGIRGRVGGMYQNRGFFLSSRWSWTVKTDQYGSQVLIPSVIK